MLTESALSQRVIVLSGLVLTCVFVVLVVALTPAASFDTWAATIIGPGILAISLPIFARQARREGDPRLFYLLTVALVLKLGGALARLFVADVFYGDFADAGEYHRYGVDLSSRFRSGEFETGLTSLTGTNFLRFLPGVVYTVIGPTRVGGYLVFSWMGFWGLFAFYRAFTIAVPEGRSRTYGYLLFFLPSMLFWPSSIGKDAWMVLALGISAYGASLLLTDRIFRGLVTATLGLWLASIVRPHIAGLLIVALLAAVVLRKTEGHARNRTLAKAASLCILLVIALVLVSRTDDFLRESAVSTRSGLTSTLQDVSQRTGIGRSRFAPSILDSPARAPEAVVTVLFRPFVTEAHNLQSFLSAMEMMFLLIVAVVRIRWILAAVRSIRRQPYVALAIVYGTLFVLAFSSVANFGILARERVQLLPFFLVLLSIPPRGIANWSTGEHARASEAEARLDGW